MALHRGPALEAPDGHAAAERAALRALASAAEPPGEAPPRARLGGLARDLWSARELLAQITRRDIRIRYAQAVMGFGWALLMPLLIVAAGLLIRFAIAHVARAQVQAPEILGMAVKALPWAFFVGALGFSTTSLTGNFELVTKVAFPRIVLPISAVLVQAFDTAIASAIVLSLAPAFGAHFGWTWLWIAPLALLALLVTSAACIFVACANLFFRDVKYLVQVVLSFGIFFTPVFFEPQMFGETGGRWLMLNPLSPVLEGLRLSVVQGHDLAQALGGATGSEASAGAWTPWYLAYSGAVAVLGLLGSSLLFRRLEHLFAEYV